MIPWRGLARVAAVFGGPPAVYAVTLRCARWFIPQAFPDLARSRSWGAEYVAAPLLTAVMLALSSVTPRIHHDINWNNAAPKIIRECHRKPGGEPSEVANAAS